MKDAGQNNQSVENKSDRCWVSIGVWGDEIPRCEKLKKVTHCRNCDVYINAGREIFERDIPDGYITEWTEKYSEKNTQSKVEQHSIIVFRIDNEWFSLPTNCFHEITSDKPVQRIPHNIGKLVLGLTNVRGQVKLCFSLKNILGLKEDANDDSARNTQLLATANRKIVIHIDNNSFVFPVDEIGGVYRFNESDVVSAVEANSQLNMRVVYGVLEFPNKKISCLDPYRIKDHLESALNE